MRVNLLLTLIGLSGTTLAQGVVLAQSAPPIPCSAPEFRQMDFWLGEWNVRWDAGPGTAAGQGRNTISRTLGNCVLQESFEGGPSTGNLIGQSVSAYDAATGRWRQTWVDNQGGYFALVGGPDGDRFLLVSARIEDGAPMQRMVFDDIKPTSLTWRWQKTNDGGKSWSDQWVIYYSRR